MNFTHLCRFFLLSFSLLPAFGLARADDPAGGWTETGKSGNVTTYERERPGSSYKEVRAVGVFDSPNWMVRNVLDDADHYAQFMPYVIESRVLSRDPAKHSLLSYAKINPPVVSKRDYTIRVIDESKPGPSAGEEIYVTRWEDASDKGPAEQKGFVRVKNNVGGWLLEPIDNGQKTRATYTLWTDGGGGVPAFLLNSLNKKRLMDLFEIVEKRVQEKQYRQNKPVL